MVSKAKFQKKLNDQTRFSQDGPNFVYFSIVDQDFLPQDQQLKITQSWLCLDKIWFDHSISLEILLKKLQLEYQNRQGFKIGNFSTSCNPMQSFSTVSSSSLGHDGLQASPKPAVCRCCMRLS